MTDIERINKIREILLNKESCAEDMLAEIGEIVGVEYED